MTIDSDPAMEPNICNTISESRSPSRFNDGMTRASPVVASNRAKVASINCGTTAHLSETAGALADAAPAGTGTDVKVGKIVALSDNTPTRVLYVAGPVVS